MFARLGLKGNTFVGTCMHTKAPLSTTAVKQIFNRPLKAKQRLQASKLPDYQYYEYLREEMASRLIDRLEDISRPFPVALELGSHTGIFGRKISEGDSLRSGRGGIGGIEKLLQTDMAIFGPRLEGAQVADVNALFANAVGDKVKIANLSLDEEHMSLPENTFDLVVSNSNLHWVNDIPTTFKQVQHVLKPDGAFIATMLGGATLQELRHSFFLADQERKGGTGQHASPMALASDVAALMQAANFSLPTVDVDTIQVGYPDLFSLMEHLYGMGESSASFNRSLNVGKDTMMAAAAIYQELYGLDDGTIPATFEVIYMIGWKPDASQPKACRRGSAEVSLKELNKLQ